MWRQCPTPSFPARSLQTIFFRENRGTFAAIQYSVANACVLEEMTSVAALALPLSPLAGRHTRIETSDERTILTALSSNKTQHIDEDDARRTRSDCAHITSHERPTRHMAWTYVILHYLGVERLVLHDSKSWSRRKSRVRQEFSTSDTDEPVCIRCCPANVSGASGKSGLTYLPLTWFCKCACICSTSPLG